MSDTIYRQDAINVLEKLSACEEYGVEVGTDEETYIGKYEAITEISDLPSADRPQGWIPCSERLPKIGEYHISEPCLVYCKGGVYAFAELEENIFGQVGWNCERDDDYHEPIGEVVAWMPLPKPWKGADDEADKSQSE